ncbi:hypothetical protein E0H73_41725 [Kribbella pittospori]|uniref:Uncharacterized protein n=1 Tax=Kribbella pittospori TaxID=722689 RepID=A0A4R0JVZ0_9ACTN|nr:hypothetical protein E0H73_41725 [Kribbella pittospori]
MFRRDSPAEWRHSPVLAQVYAEDPELAASHPTLLPTLVRTLSALAAGLLTLRNKEPRLPTVAHDLG